MSRQYVTSPYAQGAAPPAAGGHPPSAPVLPQALALGAAAATTALLAAAGIIATVQEGALRTWWEGSEPTNGTVTLLNLLNGLTAVTNIAALVATGLWLLAIRSIAEWTSPGTCQRHAAYWCFLGWVVPVVNLWIPLQVVEDASRRVGSRVRTFWPWWIAWLALVGFSLFGPSGGELITDADFVGWIRAQQVCAGLAVLAFVLWWRIVRSSTAAAVSARAGSRVDS